MRSSCDRSSPAPRCRPRRRARSRPRPAAGAAGGGSRRPPATISVSASASHDRHRSPPEVERVGPRGPSSRKQSDEPEVGRVEDVPAAEADHVLRQQRDRRGRRRRSTSRAGSTSRRARCRATRRMKATPLPVSIALAGHMITCWRRKVIATSSTAHVSSETRICAIESRKSNATCPRTCSEMITPARCRRGSRRLGSSTGIGRAAEPQRRFAGAGSAHRGSWYAVAPRIPYAGTGLEDRRVRLYASPTMIEFHLDPAVRRRPVPADRPAGEGGAPARPARRRRPAADGPRGRRRPRDQPEHRGEGLPRARARPASSRRAREGARSSRARSSLPRSSTTRIAPGAARRVAASPPSRPGSTTRASVRS